MKMSKYPNASQSYLCDPMVEKFATYLRNGETIWSAYFRAGRNGEATATAGHHLQTILYIPQALNETIYSPKIDYNYSISNIGIMTRDIQGN